MPRVATKSPGKVISAHWDGLDPFGRLELILSHAEAFLFYHLVSPGELQVAESMSESQWEYVIDREERPLFTSIDLKNEFRAQNHRDKLKAALRAVLL